MAQKGAKLTAESEHFAKTVVDRLSGLGDVTTKRMFGGFGVFESGRMFGLISGVQLHFKVDDSNRAAYEEAGSERHKPMPYYSVPETVMADTRKLKAWGKESIAVAHASKKK